MKKKALTFAEKNKIDKKWKKNYYQLLFYWLAAL